MLKIPFIIASLTLLFFTGCADERTAGVERRQDRIDSRTQNRLDRREIRSNREDARSEARFDAW